MRTPSFSLYSLCDKNVFAKSCNQYSPGMHRVYEILHISPAIERLQNLFQK